MICCDQFSQEFQHLMQNGESCLMDYEVKWNRMMPFQIPGLKTQPC